ncbi:MAG: hypothetical protein ACR2LN_04660 [Candidatus Levyibacteriota bacterium]
MINFNAKLTTAVATAAIVLGAVSPAAFANTNVTVSHNGALSDTSVQVRNTTNTTVAQNNDSTVLTDVSSHANTGGNNADFNTGGSTIIGTGDANSTVNVTVGGSSNTAIVPTPADNTTHVTVSHNGALSTNKVNVSNHNWVSVAQQNLSYIWTSVTSHSKTGGNSSSFNTGGTTGVGTGNVTSNVTVHVNGSSNTLY